MRKEGHNGYREVLTSEGNKEDSRDLERRSNAERRTYGKREREK